MKRRIAILSVLVVALAATGITAALVRRHMRKAAAKTEIAYPRQDVLDIVRQDSTPARVSSQLRTRYQPWMDSYRLVLDRLLHAGYVIKPMDQFDAEKLGEKIVYMRHDVHARDISGAACMMDLENELGVGATYFLLWEYSDLEKAQRQNFLALKKLAGPNHRFGLHHSLVEEYIYSAYFQGQGPNLTMKELKEFSNAPLFEEIWNTKLRFTDPDWPKTVCYADPDKIESAALRKMVEFTHGRLREHLTGMRHHFGEVTTIAAHGGALGDLANAQRKSWSRAESENLCSEYLFSKRFLSEQGILFEAYQLPRQYDLPALSDNDGRWDLLEKQLDNALKRGKAFSILIHPYLWESKTIVRKGGTE